MPDTSVGSFPVILRSTQKQREGVMAQASRCVGVSGAFSRRVWFAFRFQTSSSHIRNISSAADRLNCNDFRQNEDGARRSPKSANTWLALAGFSTALGKFNYLLLIFDLQLIL